MRHMARYRKITEVTVGSQIGLEFEGYDLTFHQYRTAIKSS
jgi:hypothetical protein